MACTLAPVEGLSQPEAQKGYLRPHGHQSETSGGDSAGCYGGTEGDERHAIPGIAEWMATG